MKDEKYVFFEEIKEKAQTARGAFAKTRTLTQTAPYTSKELEALNGPTEHINVEKPVPYSTFRTLPDTLKSEYLSYIVANYRVGSSAISKMMSCSDTTIINLCRKYNIALPKMTYRKDTIAFARKYIPLCYIEQKKPEPTQAYAMQSVMLRFNGQYNSPEIIRTLEAMNLLKRSLNITINFTAE